MPSGELDTDDLLELVAYTPRIEERVPGNEHRFAEVDVVSHHRVKAWIGRAVRQAFLDVRPELGRLEPLDVEHGDIGHFRTGGQGRRIPSMGNEKRKVKARATKSRVANFQCPVTSPQ